MVYPSFEYSQQIVTLKKHYNFWSLTNKTESSYFWFHGTNPFIGIRRTLIKLLRAKGLTEFEIFND